MIMMNINHHLDLMISIIMNNQLKNNIKSISKIFRLMVCYLPKFKAAFKQMIILITNYNNSKRKMEKQFQLLIILKLKIIILFIKNLKIKILVDYSIIAKHFHLLAIKKCNKEKKINIKINLCIENKTKNSKIIMII